MSQVITTKLENGVATVTLNRPEALNALSVSMQRDITCAFNSLKRDDAIKAIIFTGSGRAFSAGLDVKELGERGFSDPDYVSNKEIAPLKAILEVDKPVICAVNGYAITGGFELALACDILIGSTDAKFADTHVRMGVVPGWGLTQRLAKLVGASRAKQLSFTGNYLSAEKAAQWGIINDVLPPEELLPYCRQLAEDISGANQTVLRKVSELIDYGWEHDLASGLEMEMRVSTSFNTAINKDELKSNQKILLSRSREQQK